MNGGHPVNQMFRRFLERISDCAIFVLNRSGGVETWNDGARAIIGYDTEEIVGRHVSTLYDLKTCAPDVVTQALATAATAGRHETETWQVAKDGRRFWAGITTTAILDDGGEVAGFGIMLRDLTERLKAEQQKASVIALLEQTAGTDFLTGVANRRSLDRYLATSLDAARQTGRSLTVAMVDLDHFKLFNDTHGHQAGDAYLREVIVFWSHVLRGECLLARYGGEEFTVVMPETTLAQAVDAMNRLREATPPPITCSIGIAAWDGSETAEALIHRADRRLYAAKGAGRNRVDGGGESDLRQVARRTVCG